MRYRQKTLVLIGLVVMALAVLAGCNGADGPFGPQATQPQAGAGQDAAQETAAVALPVVPNEGAVEPGAAGSQAQATEEVTLPLVPNDSAAEPGASAQATEEVALPLVPNDSAAEPGAAAAQATEELALPLVPNESAAGPGAAAAQATEELALPLVPNQNPADSGAAGAQAQPQPEAQATQELALPLVPNAAESGVQATPVPESPQVFTPTYSIQPGTPAGIFNIVEPDAGCNWTGIGGQVFDADQNPVQGLVVEVTGELDGAPVLLLTLSGNTIALGPGGYGMRIADRPLDTRGQLAIQLFNLNGSPLTQKLPFDTFADCERNMTLLNFVQITSQPAGQQYLPFVPVQP